MITPEFLNDITIGTEEAVAKLNEDLIKRIAKRIEAGFKFDGQVKFIPSTINDFHKLLNQGAMMQDIEIALTQALPNLSAEIREVFERSASEIATSLNSTMSTGIEVNLPDGTVLKAQDISGVPKGKTLTAPEMRQLETIYRRTQGEVRNLTKTTALQASNQAYIEACDSAYMKVKSGMSIDRAIADAVKEMADKGITMVTYGSGHNERMEVAIARAVRTGVAQANAEVILTRCAEMGVGYVRVSAHTGARVTKVDDYTNHAWWQGKVYSLNFDDPALAKFAYYAQEGREQYPNMVAVGDAIRKDNGAVAKEYPDFVETCGYGKIQGICGINCRHTFFPFFPDYSTNTTKRPTDRDNEEAYENTQKLRALERLIRKVKRIVLALSQLSSKEAKEDVVRAKKRLKDLTMRYDALMDETGHTGANWRRWITSVKDIWHK